MEKRYLIKTYILFMLILSVGQNLNSQGLARKKYKTNVEKFTLVPFFEAIDKDSIRVVTLIEIPFYTLQFVKDGDGFIAAYQASIALKGKNDEDWGHEIWTDSIRAISYVDTKSNTKNIKHYAIHTLPVGSKYQIIAELQDADTRKKGVKIKKLNLKPYTSRPILVDPIFLMSLQGNWGFDPGKIPTMGFKVREFGDGIELLFSGFVNNDPFDINIYLSNGTSDDSLIHNYTGQGGDGYFNDEIFISSDQLKSLKNDFKIVLTQNGTTEMKKISFSTYKPGVSNYVYNIELALKQMKYITTNEEQLIMKGKSKKEKEQLFYELWKKRDPTANTEYNEIMEEYYGRIWYANEHFDSWQPGWESDRGMIYILFGPPDEIQRTNPTTSSSSVYQVWSYYKISKQFIFKDSNGFGDFRLETPFLGAGL
tara:strand:- start:3658 stop:4929 length:1272 start_codon:yes stop_codon:yes gene_type:complete